MIDTLDIPVSATDFAARLERLTASDEPHLSELRRAALARFGELGWPTRHDEAWKYTTLAPLARSTFVDPAEASTPAELLVERHGPDADADRLVFVDGRLSLELSRLPEDFEARSLRDALASGNLSAEALAPSRAEAHALVALNLAQFEDGALLRVPPGTKAARPLELVFAQRTRNVASHPRVHVQVERQASLTLIERHIDLGSGASFENAFLELSLDAAADVDHYRLVTGTPEAFQIGMTRASLERDARLRSHVFAFGGALVRDEIDVRFRDEGGDVELGGLYVVGGNEHVDCRTFVDHAVPHCGSRQVYHGAAGGRGHGIFGGEVLVREGAQGTEAHQTNRNLLLSDGATADTKPQLEILADDVQCSHGATIGQLDPDALFYLRSRALDASQARLVLTRAFANTIADAVRPDGLRKTLETLLATRLAAVAGSSPAA